MVSASRSHLFLPGLLLVVSLRLPLARARLPDAPTAYDLLLGYDFPIGILPAGVQSYLLRDDGTFDVHLAKECEFMVGGYLLRYKKKISGKVAMDLLSDLKGISVQILFFWVGVNDAVRDGDELRFYVGPLATTFPVSTFYESPECRTGAEALSADAYDFGLLRSASV